MHFAKYELKTTNKYFDGFCYILNNLLYISCMKDEHKEYLALAVLAVALMAVGGFIVYLASELTKPY